MLCCVNALLLPVNVTLYLCVVFVYSISLCTVLVCACNAHVCVHACELAGMFVSNQFPTMG